VQGEALRKEAERLQVTFCLSEKRCVWNAQVGSAVVCLMAERVCDRARQAAGGADGASVGPRRHARCCLARPYLLEGLPPLLWLTACVYAGRVGRESDQGAADGSCALVPRRRARASAGGCCALQRRNGKWEYHGALPNDALILAARKGLDLLNETPWDVDRPPGTASVPCCIVDCACDYVNA